MKYFWIQPSIDDKEVGVFPQCIDASKFLDIQDYGLGFYEKIDKNFILPELILRNNAICTNFINAVPIPASTFLVIDDALLSFIRKSNVQLFESWKLEVYFRKAILVNYNLFHLSKPIQNQVIDFDKSIFKIRNILNNSFVEIKCYKNYEEYHNDWQKLLWEGYVISIEALFLDFSKTDFDLIRLIDLDTVGIGYYASEQLKDAIIEHGFTGIEFKEIDKIDKKIQLIY